MADQVFYLQTLKIAHYFKVPIETPNFTNYNQKFITNIFKI